MPSCHPHQKHGKNIASGTRNMSECNPVGLQDLQIDSPWVNHSSARNQVNAIA